jgi:hypothetical protein
VGEHGGRNHVGAFLDVHTKTSVTVSLCGARNGAMQTEQGHGDAASGKLHALGDFGHHSDLGVLAFMARDEQDLLVRTRVKRQGYWHSREYHAVVERYEH